MTNMHTSVLNNPRIWKKHAPFWKPFLPLMHRPIELVCLSVPRQMQTYAPIIDCTTRSTLPSLISNSIQSHWAKTEMSNRSSMKIIMNVPYPRRMTAIHWQFAPNVAKPYLSRFLLQDQLHFRPLSVNGIFLYGGTFRYAVRLIQFKKQSSSNT